MTDLVQLGDVCRVQNGYAFEGELYSEERGVPLLRIRDLKTNRPLLKYDGKFDPAYVVRRGDLLIGMDGEFRPYRWAGPDALLNQRVCRLLPESGVIDVGYLAFAIDEHLREIERTTGLTTVKHLSSKQVAGIKIRLPPLAYQRQVAAQLTSALAAVNGARDAQPERVGAGLLLRARSYGHAFLDHLPLAVNSSTDEAPAGWTWHVLTDLARLETGHTPSRSRQDWWSGDIPWIALPDIRRVDGRLTFETLETTNPEGIAHSAARVLPTDTVVMSRTASVGFVTRMGRPMATSQDFVNWVCGPDLDPEFLMHLLIRSRSEIRNLASGAIHKTVYFPTVKTFRVCVPSSAEQRRIAADLRERLATIDAMESAIQAERAAIEALPRALLRRAFPMVAV